MAGYIFDATKGETPEGLARRRALLDSMGARALSNTPRNLGEGLTSVAQALMYRSQLDDLSAAEQSSREYNATALSSLLGGGASVPSSAVPPSASAEPSSGMPSFSEGFKNPQIAAAAQAIKNVESSGGNYSATGPVIPKSGDRAYGAYQVMGANVPSWTEKHFGQRLTPGEFLSNKAAQDAVFAGEFGGYMAKYGPGGAQSKWFTGSPTAKGNRSDGYTTQSQYQGRFLKDYNRFLGGGASPAAPAAQQMASADPGAGSIGDIPINEPRPVAAPIARAPVASVAPTQVAPAPPATAAIPIPEFPTGQPTEFDDAVAQKSMFAANPNNNPAFPGTTPAAPVDVAEPGVTPLEEIKVTGNARPVPMPPVRPAPIPAATPVSLQREVPMAAAAPMLAAQGGTANGAGYEPMPREQPNGAAVLAGFAPIASGRPGAAQPQTAIQRVAAALPSSGPAAASAPATAAVQQVAQAVASPSGGIDQQRLMRVLADPRSSDTVKSIATLMYKQQQELNDPDKALSREKTRLELELLRDPSRDPTKKLALEKSRLEIERLKNPEQPNDVRSYEYYAKRETAAGREPLGPLQYEQALRKSGASNVNVETGGTGELRKSLDKKQGDAWSTILDAGTQSAGASQDIELLEELSKGAPQGPLTGRLAQAFPGVNSSADAFNSVISRVAPTLRAPGSGATSDIEYEGMRKSLPSLVNKPEANRAIIGMMKAKAEINVQRADVITRYQNGEISDVDARRALADMNRRSIMTPELQGLIKDAAPPEEQAKPAAPKAGEVRDGWMFKGGDPSKRENWERNGA